MSGTSQKLRALFLAVIMVTSVMAGTMALSGAATAAFNDGGLPGGLNDQTSEFKTTAGATTEISDLTFTSSGNVSSVQVNATGGSNGAISVAAIDAVTVRLFNGTNVTAEATATYNAHNTTVDFSGNVSGVDRIVVLAHLSSTAPDGAVADAFLNVSNNPVAFLDTLNNQTVENDETGFISGRVSDQNNNDIKNASVNFIATNGTVIKNTSTNADGEYTVELPPGDYNATVQKPGFSTAEAKDLTVRANKTTTANFVIRRLLVPTTIEVDPKSDAALVGDNNTFTVTVFDQDGNRLSGTPVEATTGDNDIEFVSAGGDPASGQTATASTDDAGEVTFTVTSDAITEGEIQFTATEGDNVTVNATKVFVQSGEGSIQGQVINDATTEGEEDVSVWAVLTSQYVQNAFTTTVNLSSIGETDDNRIWVRLVDNETNEVIDNDRYDVRVGSNPNTSTFGHSDTAVRKIEEMNTSDQTAGEGFMVMDKDGDGNATFVHTRLANDEYYVQISLNAPNASDETVNESWSQPNELFLNVTGVNAFGQVNESLGGFSPVVFSPQANLTLAATMDRANLTDSNLVDSQGYINTFDENTGGTDEDGDYKLNKLFSDFQEGRLYVAIAAKTGFSTDFADVFVQEDGQLVSFEGQSSVDFNVEPEPVEPVVNITNIALLPNSSAALDGPANDTDSYDVYRYSNQTDPFSQTVPRDGQSVDVIKVETTSEQFGDSIDENVVLHVPDVDGTSDDDRLNWDGMFIEVHGGTVVSQDPANNTITVATGSDGEAIVWLKSDLSTENLKPVFPGSTGADWLPICEREELNFGFEGVAAHVEDDLGATDTSCKNFAGITQSARISGIVTDENNDPITDAIVWTGNIDLDNDGVSDFIITPVNDAPPSANGYQEFNVTYTGDFPGNVVNWDIATRDELRHYEFDAFPRVTSTEEFTLLTTTDEDTTEAKFTLPTVPAEGNTFDATPGSTSYVVRGVTRGSGETGFGPANVIVNSTDDTNIVIVGVDPAEFRVSNTTATPNPASQGEDVTVEADIRNIGDLLGSSAVTLSIDGSVVDSQSVSLGADDSVTVAFTASTSGLSLGNHTVTVSTDDDSQSTVLEVVESTGGAVCNYANDNGVVELSGLSAAVDDWAAGDIGIGLLSDVVDAWASGDPQGC